MIGDKLRNMVPVSKYLLQRSSLRMPALTYGYFTYHLKPESRAGRGATNRDRVRPLGPVDKGRCVRAERQQKAILAGLNNREFKNINVVHIEALMFQNVCGTHPDNITMSCSPTRWSISSAAELRR